MKYYGCWEFLGVMKILDMKYVINIRDMLYEGIYYFILSFTIYIDILYNKI